MSANSVKKNDSLTFAFQAPIVLLCVKTSDKLNLTVYLIKE